MNMNLSQRYRVIAVAMALLIVSVGATAQDHQGHQDHQMPKADSGANTPQHDSTHAGPTSPAAQVSSDTNMPTMGTTAGTFGSGTSIEPMSTDASKSMLHSSFGNWEAMFHANVFILDTQQTGPRGKDKFFSANWFMPMLMRETGRNTVMFRAMLSLEPATVTKRRYPELFQTGETAFGLPIVDGQHPHDLFMELAGMYRLKAGEHTQFFVYGGPVGEPALGPTAYPHRASASENPFAVLGHHQQDSTHIANSVITLGFSQGPLQLEASTFHGREPNENRWNIDKGAPDSFASRATLSFGDNLSGQFSVGRINNREALEPNLDTLRMTSSLQHNLPMARGHWSSSFIWGRNKDLADHRRIFNAYTLESTLKFRDKNWLWGRAENVDRDRTILFGETPQAATIEETPIGRIQAYTVGYERETPQFASWLDSGLGFQFTTYGLPSQLKPIYGDRPATFTVFLRLRPKGDMQSHAHH